jgi:hypothetical protein
MYDQSLDENCAVLGYTQRLMVIHYRCFGTTYRKVGKELPIPLRNSSEEHSSDLLRSGSLKSRRHGIVRRPMYTAQTEYKCLTLFEDLIENTNGDAQTY